MSIELELNYKNNLEYLYNNWKDLYNDIINADIDDYN